MIGGEVYECIQMIFPPYHFSHAIFSQSIGEKKTPHYHFAHNLSLKAHFSLKKDTGINVKILAFLTG